MQQTPASFSDFLNNFVTYFIPISTMFFAWFYAVLKEPDTKAEYISKLKKFHFLPFYRYWLKNILDKIDNYLGKPKFSKKFITLNIIFHFSLSVLYIVFIFILLWFIDGKNEIGSIVIFPDKYNFFKSLNNFNFTYFIFFTSILVMIESIIKPKLIGVFTRILVIVVFFILFIGIVSYLTKSNFFVKDNIALFLFFIIFPFLNAILDFLSLTISRYFSRKIANGESLFLILFHLLLDLVLAIVFFVGLAYILYYGVELFNILVDKKLQIPIGKMLVDAIKEPFALKNAWITFMLFSTLIPTLLHILLALVSFLLQITNLSPFYAKLIEESELRETKKIKATLFMTVPTSMIFISMLYGIYRLYLLFV